MPKAKQFVPRLTKNALDPLGRLRPTGLVIKLVVNCSQSKEIPEVIAVLESKSIKIVDEFFIFHELILNKQLNFF